MASAPDSAMIRYLRKVLTRVGVVHRFLLAQEFRLLMVALALAPVLWLIEHGEDHAMLTDRHVLEDVEPERGHAAITRIPDAVRQAVAERGFRLCESRLPATRIGYFVNNRMARRFPEFHQLPFRFRCFDEDFGGRIHAEVRNEGGGLHDLDGDVLRLSGSEPTPASNGRVYLISIPWAPPVLAVVAMACQALIALFGYVLVRKRVWPWVREGYRSDRSFNTVAAAVVSTGVVLLVAATLMEAYLRWRIPFTEVEWPGRFDPELGFVFQPNARVRWTNGLEFWVEETSNSLGFLDREPTVPKPDGMFRVLVIGDSFVAAAQVGVAEKMHVQLEARLRDALGTDKVDTVAFGYSGTGQSNQLSFYDVYGADIDADLVVLLFHSNDFGNNSAVLESVSYGWDPWRPPRLFYEPDESGAAFVRVGIDANWFDHRLSRRMLDPASHQRLVMERYPETRALLDGWPASSVHQDCVFYADELPPLFQRAVASTEHALRLFKERTKNRGEALLLVTTPGVVGGRQYCGDNCCYALDERNQLKRITRMAERVGIPILDLYSVFAERGDWRDATLPYDAHWSALGHRWAAEAIADYLVEHRELLGPTHGELP